MNDSASMMPRELWRRALVPADASLQQAIVNLDETGLQIALVVSGENVLLGTVTDGDIRRGLLRGLDLNSRVDQIMYREPLVVPPTLGRDIVLQLMQANRFHQLPVVDARAPHRRAARMGRAAGTRAAHRTSWSSWPAARASACDRTPSTVRSRCSGQRQADARAHHRARQGRGIPPLRAVGSLPRPDDRGLLRRRQSLAGSNRLSARVVAARHRGCDRAARTRPDAAVRGVQRRCAHRHPLRRAAQLSLASCRDAATMAVRLYEWQHPFGVVHIKGVDIVGFEEKPIARSHINAGIYVLDPAALDVLTPGEQCDMPTLFARLQERAGRTLSIPCTNPGSMSGALPIWNARIGVVSSEESQLAGGSRSAVTLWSRKAQLRDPLRWPQRDVIGQYSLPWR